MATQPLRAHAHVGRSCIEPAQLTADWSTWCKNKKLHIVVPIGPKSEKLYRERGGRAGGVGWGGMRIMIDLHRQMNGQMH